MLQPERVFRYMKQQNDSMRIARVAQFGEGQVEVWQLHETSPGGRVAFHVDVPSAQRVERYTTRGAALDAARRAFDAIGGGL